MIRFDLLIERKTHHWVGVALVCARRKQRLDSAVPCLWGENCLWKLLDIRLFGLLKALCLPNTVHCEKSNFLGAAKFGPGRLVSPRSVENRL